jgi:hypothetical protein
MPAGTEGGANMTTNALVAADYSGVHSDIVSLLEAARTAAARSVNAVMTAAYWGIGRRIVEFEQAGQDRAAYGEALLVRLEAFLPNLACGNDLPDTVWQIGRPLTTIPLALVGLCPLALSIKSPSTRAFYESEALRCGWSVLQTCPSPGTVSSVKTVADRRSSIDTDPIPGVRVWPHACGNQS